MNEQDGIPDCGRCRVIESESSEIELPLANAMHQLNARNRGRGTPEPFEAEHHIRSGLDVAMILFDQIVLEGNWEVSVGSAELFETADHADGKRFCRGNAVC